MTVLILTVCLIASPATCEQRDLAAFIESGPMTCPLQAPAMLTGWQDEHPNWRVAKWWCETRRRN